MILREVAAIYLADNRKRGWLFGVTEDRVMQMIIDAVHKYEEKRMNNDDRIAELNTTLECLRCEEVLKHIDVTVLLDDLDRFAKAHEITGPKSTAEIMDRAYRWIEAANGLARNRPDESITVDGMVAISQEKYNQLIEADAELNNLYNAGVDNWEGYDEARRAE